MSEIALDAICDASARSKDEQFLSMLKNSATCSALQCGVFDISGRNLNLLTFRHYPFIPIRIIFSDMFLNERIVYY